MLFFIWLSVVLATERAVASTGRLVRTAQIDDFQSGYECDYCFTYTNGWDLSGMPEYCCLNYGNIIRQEDKQGRAFAVEFSSDNTESFDFAQYGLLLTPFDSSDDAQESHPVKDEMGNLSSEQCVANQVKTCADHNKVESKAPKRGLDKEAQDVLDDVVGGLTCECSFMQGRPDECLVLAKFRRKAGCEEGCTNAIEGVSPRSSRMAACEGTVRPYGSGASDYVRATPSPTPAKPAPTAPTPATPAPTAPTQTVRPPPATPSPTPAPVKKPKPWYCFFAFWASACK